MSNGRCFSCGQFHATAHSLTEKMAELTAERDSLAASLEAKDAEMSKLSARIYAASSALRSELTLHCGRENVLTDGMKYALAILAPPEAPTDKGGE